MALTDYSIDTSGTPQDVQRKQALADALMKQGMDSSAAAGGPNGGWITALNRGLAGALGGYQRGAAANEEAQGRSHAQQLAAGLLGPDGKVNQQAYVQAASDPWVRPEQLGAVGKVADWQHQSERDKVGDQHWGASFGLQQNADKRAELTSRRQNMSEAEKLDEKKKALIANGIDPNSQQGQVYLGLLQDKTPFGWNNTPGGGIEPTPNGPNDPNYISRKNAATTVPPRPLTPEERAAYGLPANAPAAMTAEGPKGIGAGNTVINTGENKGLNEAAKIDAETVRKGMNETMPALDDADHNFQIMQDAIDRNGGKLPTGGVLGKLGLDARRTSGYIRDNWGVDLGDDPTTATALETFNKGGIKASGDMAKAIGGNRVLKVEFDMAQRANPGLETTDGGNKYLLDINRNTLAIKREYLQAQEDYWRSHDHSLDGFQKEWNAKVKADPKPLSNFSVVTPIDNGDGSKMVKLPSTGQGGYTWYRKGPDGLQPVTDKEATGKLDDSTKPIRETAKQGVPLGVDPKLWQHMTPAEQAAWK